MFKEAKIPFKLHKCLNLPQESEEDTEELNPLIEIDKKIYEGLKRLCAINNWDVHKKINNILDEAVDSAEIMERGGQKLVENF